MRCTQAITRLALLAAALLVALLALVPVASARRPIVSYLDQAGFHLHDLQKKKNVKAPPIPVPNAAGFRYAMSLDGRFVVYLDADKKIHLYDRFAKGEQPVPGIDVFNNPGNLTVSDLGLVAFDDNGNGPTRVYDYKQRRFVDVGFNANNKQRQPKLSGNGRFLATTCLDAANCVVDLGNDSNPYVQALKAKRDTGFGGEVDMRDEEHPCINRDGSLVALDRPSPNANSERDVFLYKRKTTQLIRLPMDPQKPETFCMMDPTGGYVGWLFDNNVMRVYERKREKFLQLPDGVDNRSQLTSALQVSRFRARPKRIESGESTSFLFNLTTKANVSIRIERREGGDWDKVGTITRRDRIGGKNKMSTGRTLNGRELEPGSYRAQIKARAWGFTSAKRTARFTVES